MKKIISVFLALVVMVGIFAWLPALGSADQGGGGGFRAGGVFFDCWRLVSCIYS